MSMCDLMTFLQTIFIISAELCSHQPHTEHLSSLPPFRSSSARRQVTSVRFFLPSRHAGVPKPSSYWPVCHHSVTMASENDIDLDSIIDRLLEVRGSRPGKQVQLLEQEIRFLCTKAREIFISQPILLELEAPIKVRISNSQNADVRHASCRLANLNSC
jgi:hypothetical protein